MGSRRIDGLALHVCLVGANDHGGGGGGTRAPASSSSASVSLSTTALDGTSDRTFAKTSNGATSMG